MMLPTFHAVRGPDSLYVQWQDAYDSREFYPRLDESGGAAQLSKFYPNLGEASRNGLAWLERWPRLFEQRSPVC